MPVIWPVLVCITIITPYIIAVSLGHVYPFLPSISKAASFEPQASLFGALMTLVAFLGLAMMVARYVQVQAVPGHLECEFSSKIIRLNKVGLRFGISCLIGVVLVASVRSSAKVVITVAGRRESGPPLGKLHDAATALLFVSGIPYLWFQTAITFFTAKMGLHSKCVFIFRLVVSCTITCAGIGYPFFKWFSYTRLQTGSSVDFWSPGDGGYALHLFSTIGEWVACLCLALFPASFYEEFKTFSLEIHHVKVKELTDSRKSDYVKIGTNDD